MTIILTSEELAGVTGYRTSKRQLKELHRQGFYRARNPRQRPIIAPGLCPPLTLKLALLPLLALLVLAGGFAALGHFKASRAASYCRSQVASCRRMVSAR